MAFDISYRASLPSVALAHGSGESEQLKKTTKTNKQQQKTRDVSAESFLELHGLPETVITRSRMTIIQPARK